MHAYPSVELLASLGVFIVVALFVWFMVGLFKNSLVVRHPARRRIDRPISRSDERARNRSEP